MDRRHFIKALCLLPLAEPLRRAAERLQVSPDDIDWDARDAEIYGNGEAAQQYIDELLGEECEATFTIRPWPWGSSSIWVENADSEVIDVSVGSDVFQLQVWKE